MPATRSCAFTALFADRKTAFLYPHRTASLLVESEEVSPGVVLDYNEANEVVGVELLHLSKRSSSRETTEKVRQLIHDEAKPAKSVPMQVHIFA